MGPRRRYGQAAAAAVVLAPDDVVHLRAVALESVSSRTQSTTTVYVFPTASPESTSSARTAFPIAAVAGGVAAGIALVVVIVVAYCWWWTSIRRRIGNGVCAIPNSGIIGVASLMTISFT